MTVKTRTAHAEKEEMNKEQVENVEITQEEEARNRKYWANEEKIEIKQERLVIKREAELLVEKVDNDCARVWCQGYYFTMFILWNNASFTKIRRL